MLTADQLHHAALRKAAAGNRMAKRGQMGKAKSWWRYAARQAEQAGNRSLSADLWRKAGNETRAKTIMEKSTSGRGEEEENADRRPRSETYDR